MRVCVHVQVHVHLQVHAHAWMHVYMCMVMRIYVRMFVRMYTHTCMLSIGESTVAAARHECVALQLQAAHTAAEGRQHETVGEPGEYIPYIPLPPLKSRRHETVGEPGEYIPYTPLHPLKSRRHETVGEPGECIPPLLWVCMCMPTGSLARRRAAGQAPCMHVCVAVEVST